MAMQSYCGRSDVKDLTSLEVPSNGYAWYIDGDGKSAIQLLDLLDQFFTMVRLGGKKNPHDHCCIKRIWQRLAMDYDRKRTETINSNKG